MLANYVLLELERSPERNKRLELKYVFSVGVSCTWFVACLVKTVVLYYAMHSSIYSSVFTY